MNTANTFENDPFLAKYGKDVFRSNVKAMRPLAATHVATLTIAACAAAVVASMLAFSPVSADTGSASTELSAIEIQGAVSTKGDRIADATPVQSTTSSLPGACEGQAWGAYSADCAAALTGQSSVRAVTFRTIERPAPTQNTTILARVPSNG